MEENKKETKNVNYEYIINYQRLAELKSAVAILLISMTMIVFIISYTIFYAMDSKHFVTENHRIGSMLYGVFNGWFIYQFSKFFAQSWVWARRIQDEELEDMINFNNLTKK